QTRTFWAVALVLFAVTATALPAAPPETAKRDKPSEYPAEKLRKALDQVKEVEIVNQMLSTAVEQLRDQTGIPFVLDKSAQWLTLPLTPMGNFQPITISGKKVKLRTALHKALAPFGLSTVILHEEVLITSTEQAVHLQMRQPVTLDLKEVALKGVLQ